MEKLLTDFLIRVDNLSLNEHQKLVVANLFYSVNDIERVGDHCENLAELAGPWRRRSCISRRRSRRI